MARKHLKIICSVELFPSDNKIDGGRLQDRIKLKNSIKRDAVILACKWCVDNKFLFNGKPMFEGQAEVTLTVFYKDKRRRDIHNLSIKTFLDQIVNYGFIADDNIDFIPKTTLCFGGYTDKESYAVFEIKEL